MYDGIRYEIADGIATITLDRPEKLNACTPELGEEVVSAFERCRGDDDVRVVILTGAGAGAANREERRRAVHIAKAEAGLAARVCARTRMQVHGGVGYTFEHGLHYWLRRAYAGDAFMGPSSHHHDCLADFLFD
jgi:alkylation response protein AidB-like acyl-CoA dehydrogenase